MFVIFWVSIFAQSRLMNDPRLYVDVGITIQDAMTTGSLIRENIVMRAML